MEFIRPLYYPKISEILLREQLYRQKHLPIELIDLIEEHGLNLDSSTTLSSKYGGRFNVEGKGADKKRYFDYRNAILLCMEDKVLIEKESLGLDYPEYLHGAMKASSERKLLSERRGRSIDLSPINPEIEMSIASLALLIIPRVLLLLFSCFSTLGLIKHLKRNNRMFKLLEGMKNGFINLFSKREKETSPSEVFTEKDKEPKYRDRVEGSKEYNSLDEVKKRKHAYYQANKEKFNEIRREKRKLAKEMAIKKVN